MPPLLLVSSTSTIEIDSRCFSILAFLVCYFLKIDLAVFNVARRTKSPAVDTAWFPRTKSTVVVAVDCASNEPWSTRMKMRTRLSSKPRTLSSTEHRLPPKLSSPNRPPSKLVLITKDPPKTDQDFPACPISFYRCFHLLQYFLFTPPTVKTL